MRELFLLILIFAIGARTFSAVQAGILGWTWLTLMTPQKLVWGFATVFPLNLILAIITFVAWIVSREPKRLPMNALMVLWLLFLAYITFTTFFALAPDLAWPKWGLTIKVMILGLVVTAVMTNQVRIHALVWVIVLSLGYYGVKGGLFTIITGGHYRVQPAESSLGDTNNLALALCMVLPLMNYLRLQSAHLYVRIGAAVAMGLTGLGILGTYSRGGFIGLSFMGVYLWWQSRSRIAIGLVAVAIALPAINFMPATWIDRIKTIQTPNEDASVRDRFDAWRTEVNIAKAHPITRGGFNASENASVYGAYNADPAYGGAHAAHSIYFEVLGDHGFVGLGIYMILLITVWYYAGATRRRARRTVRLSWIADLAAMIQVSLLSFMVAGAALSMAYYDMLYLLLGITIALHQMVLESRTQTQPGIPLQIQALAGPIIAPHQGL